jgi:oligopeptide/dipeptide ABC transporter ATP-binding protein
MHPSESPNTGWFAVSEGSETTLIQTTDVSVRFKIRRREALMGKRLTLVAVDEVSVRIGENETLGLVGESGSGKSTLGRAILRMVDVEGGQIAFRGMDITSLTNREMRSLRREMSLIFQDPNASLNPSMVAWESVAEPLAVHERASRKERRDRAGDVMASVRLQPHHLDRYPHEFSTGQRQRLAIARAIILQPSFVVADEAVSSLDAATQSQVIKLLLELQDRLGLSYLFIAHDLALVRQISTRIAVMYLGQIVEIGPSERIWSFPAHPYTAALLSAIPEPDPLVQRTRQRIILSGEVPNPIDPPSGCRFHTRCPWAMDICREVDPGESYVKCHLHSEGPQLDGASVRGLPMPAGGNQFLPAVTKDEA